MGKHRRNENEVVGIENTGYARRDRLAAGTANSTTFLRGDQTWAAPPTGTAQLRFRSETTAVITALAGLTLVVEKVA